MIRDCLVCRKQANDPPPLGGVIHRDNLVYISHAQQWDDKPDVYLGHLMLETRRHVAELAELTSDEARAVGLWSARLAEALMATTGVEHVYSFVIGDAVPHLHIHLIGRYPGAPQEYRGPRVDDWPEAPRGGEAEVGQLNSQVRDYIHSQWL